MGKKPFMGADLNDSDNGHEGDNGVTLPSGALRVNFAAIKGNIYPDGEYYVVVKKSTVGIADSGFPKISLQLQILEGDYKDRIIFHTLSFAPNADWALKAHLIGLGFPEGYDDEIDPASLVGIEAYATVETFTNQKTNKVTGKPYGEQNRVKSLSQSSNARSFDALLGVDSLI